MFRIMNKKKIIGYSIGAVVLATASFVFSLRGNKLTQNLEEDIEEAVWEVEYNIKALVQNRPEDVFVPPAPPDLERVKRQGCVTDGLLNGWNGSAGRNVAMINRSECYYLHRAVETWLEAPDFDQIKKNLEKLEKEDRLIGMFLAEAIDKKADYFNRAREKDFDFAKMCRPGTNNFWGEHTCQPSFNREEYRQYVRQITEDAMDLGVQVFMFGQVFYQDNLKNPDVGKVIKEMREYAEFKGMEILIGAQTNSIENEDYLRQFDFIEGGVGLNYNGTVEEGHCFSRYQTNGEGWCWALLWHEKYKSKANNVLVHLDWSGRAGDDMATFATMSKQARAKALENLYQKFVSQDVGFLLPMLAVLPPGNPGCHGKKDRYYSADERYTCQDEKVVNAIIKK